MESEKEEKQMTTIINIRNGDPYHEKIDRTTIFGNPFRIGNDGTRSEVIKKFEKYFYADKQSWLREAAVVYLKDKILACWCKPKACHGDVIVDYLNSTKVFEFAKPE